MRTRGWLGGLLIIVYVSSASGRPSDPASHRDRARAENPFQVRLFADDVPLGSLPLSVAIETSHGVSSVVIPRGTALPASYVDTFTTAEDDQPSVEVHVLQGERPMAASNRTVAKLQLRGIPPSARAVPQIEVTFAIDRTGVLRVTAKDLLTGATHLSITSSASTPPPGKAVVERILAETAAARVEDDQQRQILDGRVKLDAAIYGASKILADQQDKLPADVRARCSRALENARRSLNSNDLTTLRNAAVKVQDAVHAATATLYRGAAPPQ